MVAQQALEHGAQIGCRCEVAILVEICGFQPRPIGDHASAFERPARQQRHSRGSVISALGAVDARGAAEFRHHREVDVFENAGASTRTIAMTNHYADALRTPQIDQGEYIGPDFASDFHTFAVGWSPSAIVWYVDGEERFRSTRGVPDEPLYVLANLAIDANAPPDVATPFPNYLEIDYIRVYQQNPEGTDHDVGDRARARLPTSKASSKHDYVGESRHVVLRMTAISRTWSAVPNIRWIVSGRQAGRFVTSGSALLVACAVALWGSSLIGVDLRRMTDLGLVSILPASFGAAFLLLTVSFCVVVHQKREYVPILLLHIAALIVMIHGTPQMLYDTLRYSWTWKHIGIVDYILRHGGVDPKITTLDVYHNWPGFFALNALITQTAGLQSPLSYAGAAPVFFNLLFLGGLLLIFRTFTRIIASSGSASGSST